MRFETKCEKLGITEEVQSIIENCECGEITKARIVELSKMRVWEIQEVIGDYLGWIGKDDEIVEWNNQHMKTFCEQFAISEDMIAEWYAKGISENGFEIAYDINKDVILVIE